MLSQFSCFQFFGTQWTVAAGFLCSWNSPGKNTGVGCHALLQGIFPTQGLNPRLLHCESESEVAQSCPTLCDPMDCNLPGSSVHGISQARIIEWVAISFSRGSFPLRDQTCISSIFYIGRQVLYHCFTWETPTPHSAYQNPSLLVS